MLLQANKRLTYATRRLQPGDQFDAAEKHGRLLVALGMAEVAAPAKLVAKFAEEHLMAATDLPDDNSLDTLRMKAEDLGVDVDKRWGAKRLAAEIEQARKT